MTGMDGHAEVQESLLGAGLPLPAGGLPGPRRQEAQRFSRAGRDDAGEPLKQVPLLPAQAKANVLGDVDPPPERGESRPTPKPAPRDEFDSDTNTQPHPNGLTGRAYCRAVVADIEKRRLQKRPARMNFDGLAANRRRAGAAVRLVGGDPESEIESRSSARYHRPSTGLRASGFREGYQHGVIAFVGDLRDLYSRMEPGSDRDCVAELGRRYAAIDVDLLESDVREAA